MDFYSTWKIDDAAQSVEIVTSHLLSQRCTQLELLKDYVCSVPWLIFFDWNANLFFSWIPDSAKNFLYTKVKIYASLNDILLLSVEPFNLEGIQVGKLLASLRCSLEEICHFFSKLNDQGVGKFTFWICFLRHTKNRYSNTVSVTF